METKKIFSLEAMSNAERQQLYRDKQERLKNLIYNLNHNLNGARIRQKNTGETILSYLVFCMEQVQEKIK